MPPTVEYCLSSHDADLDSLWDECDADLRERRCLEHCGICRDRSFAVVDGDLVVEPELSAVVRTLTDGDGAEVRR